MHPFSLHNASVTMAPRTTISKKICWKNQRNSCQFLISECPSEVSKNKHQHPSIHMLIIFFTGHNLWIMLFRFLMIKIKDSSRGFRECFLFQGNQSELNTFFVLTRSKHIWKTWTTTHMLAWLRRNLEIFSVDAAKLFSTHNSRVSLSRHFWESSTLEAACSSDVIGA